MSDSSLAATTISAPIQTDPTSSSADADIALDPSNDTTTSSDSQPTIFGNVNLDGDDDSATLLLDDEAILMQDEIDADAAAAASPTSPLVTSAPLSLMSPALSGGTSSSSASTSSSLAVPNSQQLLGSPNLHGTAALPGADDLPSMNLDSSDTPSQSSSMPPFLSPTILPQPALMSPLGPRASNGNGTTTTTTTKFRTTRPRDDADEDAMYDDDDTTTGGGEDDADGDGEPHRKKQRRSIVHPASGAATNAAAAASTAAPSSQPEEEEGSEEEEEEESEEDEDDENDEDYEAPPAAANNHARNGNSAPTASSSSAVTSSLPRVASSDRILFDAEDTEMPTLEAPASMFGSLEPHDEESVIDLTADDSINPYAPFQNSFATPAAPTASAASSNNRQSITSQLFKSSALPPSQFINGGSTTGQNPAVKIEAAATGPNKTVDLRGDSDEDQASDNKFGTVLCMVYGMKICPGRAAVRELVTLTRMKAGADANAIRVDNIISQPCGVLSKDVAAALAPLIDEKLVRVEAKVGTLTGEEMGLRVDLYGRTQDRKTVEKHLRKFAMVQYLSLFDPVVKKQAPHSGLDNFLTQHNNAAAAGGNLPGQPTYVNEFGETVNGYPPQGTSLSVREIESDLDSLFGNEIDLATMPLAETPACLRTDLHPYQRQGLAWMIQHEERRTMNVEGKSDLMMGWSKQVDANGKTSFVNKLTKEVSAEPPELARGGLLADEMGLGKTLQVLALIAASLKQNVGADGSAAGTGKITLSLKSRTLNPKRTAPTLIVCPLAVITNWEQQILHHFNPNQMLTYYTYHGPNRLRDVTQLRQYDILITTYNILSQEFDLSCAALGIDEDESDEDSDEEDRFRSLKKKATKKKRKDKKKIDMAQAAASAAAAAAFHANEDMESPEPRRAPLFEIDFFRIILDEAHTIRERNTLQSRAARALRGERRWALTGTPLVNKVDDAFSLLNFIKVPPFTSYTMWQRIVLKPMKGKDPRGMNRLQQIMSTICLRRRKNEEINGKRILQLPEKKQRTRVLELDGKEKALYDTLAESGRKQFNKLVRDGSVLSHYAYVLEILLRMRQACNHSMLVPQHYHARGFSDLAASEDKKAEILRLCNLLEDGMSDECGICHKVVDDPVITGCAHYMCKACLDTYLANPAYHNAIYFQQFLQPGQQAPPPSTTLYCPQCRQQLDKALIVSMHHKELLRLEQEQQQAAILHSKGHVTLSPKLLALLEELQLVLNAGDKAVVFSQWTSFLNILQTCLNQASVRHVRLDGQMNSANRAKALKAFEDDDEVKVFLISLKAGGVGLNLTSANHVFMMDPWWAPSVEDQAVDRIHRLGQTKECEVVRFICKGSVEEKIMELQDSKRQMTTTALTRASKSKEDQQADRLQDLLHLFK